MSLDSLSSTGFLRATSSLHDADDSSIIEFKNKLSSFSFWSFPVVTKDKDRQQIVNEQLAQAKELFANMPKAFQEKVVDFIFEECGERKIVLLLKALSIEHPSFQLSAFDTIRLAIVQDKKFSLTNSALIARFKEAKVDLDEEKLAACCDLAYRVYHPYIYRESQTSVPTSDYTLNFLWVNLNPQDRAKDTAQNIFKDGLDLSENAECITDPTAVCALEAAEKSQDKEALESWEKTKKSFTYRISKWADLHPRANINLWYDSALVTQKAQQKTFEMMRAISQSRGVNLRLRDIRCLTGCPGEIAHSLHPSTPVYYRVDILKALIADHMMISSKETAKYCVVLDIDIEPMPPQQIFDRRTLDYLSSYGYVFNRVGMNDFENSFFIFHKENKKLQQIHYVTVIKPTELKISYLRYNKKKKHITAQYVFERYPRFREEMKESIRGDGRFINPRKVVKCPPSQFNYIGFYRSFEASDYRTETFRFDGTCNIPYTRYGRNYDESDSSNEERQLEALKSWKAEPLVEPFKPL